MWDDYGSERWSGVTRAVDEYSHQHHCTFLKTSVGQVMFLRPYCEPQEGKDLFE